MMNFAPVNPDCKNAKIRLEANKAALAITLTLFKNRLRAVREFNRAAKQINISINIHNAVCPERYRVAPVPLQ